MGEVVHYAQFDHPVCKQTYSPACASPGRITASEQTELGFDISGHFHRCTGAHGLFVEYARNVGIKEAASGIGDGRTIAADNIGDLLIGVALFLRAVEQENDAHSGQGTGFVLAGSQDGFELLTLLGRQGKGSMFAHTLSLPIKKPLYKTSIN